MYTVTYFEVRCDEEVAGYSHEYFDTYQEAQAYAKSFEDWEDVRLDYVKPTDPADIPF